jgi:ABC-type sugar transport system ATPase subunit
MDAASNNVILRARSLNKRYAAQVVLDNVDIEIRPGEILALIGENGAGKSTLMRILAGVTPPDSGAIEYRGHRVTIGSVRNAQALGIAMIYQELNLVPSRTVAQNIYLGREPRAPGPRGALGMVDRRKLREQADRMLKVVGSQIAADAALSELSVGQQQLVEIAKAVSFDAKVLIMDEPTSSLSDEVAQNLLALMRNLRESGVAIVFTTHRLPEALAVADRFVVLRDGQVVGALMKAEATERRIVEMMVGRPIAQHYPKVTAQIGERPVLEVEALSGGMVRDVSFAVRPGEILGFAGLVGAGRTELARLIFGADRPSSGEIRLHGAPIRNSSPQESIRLGIGFVPEDRKKDSLVLNHSVRENMVLAGLPKLARYGVINARAVDDVTRAFTEKLGIRLRSLDQAVGRLSGGNQQKCVLSRWLILSSRVLILDEPSRGIDIGAKATIYELIGELVRDGVAVIFISSDLPEVLGLSDRVAVMSEGRIRAILDRAEATSEAVMRYASHVR